MDVYRNVGHVVEQARAITRRSSFGKALGNVVLNIAAVGGAVCLVLVVLAFFFNISLIMFKTGSMTPTIPAGSVALIREVPAEQISVGDIVTVDRPGKLPVTHRVVATEPGHSPAERMIRLKGDANEAEDIAPYPVSQAGLVFWHVPGMANVIVWFSHPWVLALITLAAGALVTWTFWPHSPRPVTDRDEKSRKKRQHAVAPASPLESDSLRGRHSAGRSFGVVVGLAVLLAPALGPHIPAAHADATDTVISGQYLRLISVIDRAAVTSLAPGDAVDWQVGVSANAPSPGRLNVSYAFSGPRELPLDIATRACTQRWVESVCPGQEVAVASIGNTAPDHEGTLLSQSSRDVRWILLHVTVPQRADLPQKSSTNLRIIVKGSGEELSTGPTDPAPGHHGGPPGTPGTGSGAVPGAVTSIEGSTVIPQQALPSTGAFILPVLLWGLAILIFGLLVTRAARLLTSRRHRG